MELTTISISPCGKSVCTLVPRPRNSLQAMDSLRQARLRCTQVSRLSESAHSQLCLPVAIERTCRPDTASPRHQTCVEDNQTPVEQLPLSARPSSWERSTSKTDRHTCFVVILTESRSWVGSSLVQWSAYAVSAKCFAFLSAKLTWMPGVPSSVQNASPSENA